MVRHWPANEQGQDDDLSRYREKIRLFVSNTPAVSGPLPSRAGRYHFAARAVVAGWVALINGVRQRLHLLIGQYSVCFGSATRN